ncbi:dynein axonemal light chain 4 isoform X1 [Kogia breviceps]|uniref:dynein axonemal light chain 4 isoform X1 n=1 Tax=Kogia breviceps TaxID=27615 RepID=UPI0034D202A0
MYKSTEQGGVPREQIAGEEARVETKPRGGETSSKVAREGAPRGAGRKAGAPRGATPSLPASGRVSCARRLLHSDMPEEMRVEAVELCVAACEKFSNNNESAAKMIKETMDKKFGSSWHVVIGEGFGFEITHEVKNLLYLYFGGTLAVCVWKCS